jgi:dihydroxyacetone kinase-like predicted kinase
MLKQNEDAGFVTLYYGEDVKKEDAESLLEELCDKHTDLDFELTDGGQSVYYYIISVE